MRKLLIGMITGGLKFAGDQLEKGSLGGSETAFLCMARELAKRGHTVKVWTNNDRPGKYDGVDYLPIESYEQCAVSTTFDVLISSRWPEFLALPNRAALRILWNHDTLTDKQRLMSTIWQTDEVWLLSDYHILDYCGEVGEEPGEENPKLPELRPHVWKTSNGVDMDLVKANLRPKVSGKCIYTSRPERGLLTLLKMVPQIAAKVPDFKLYYANYSLEGMQLPEHVVQCVQECNALAAQMPQHVVQLGHLTKDKLYQEMSSAQLLLYPTNFPEISMITAIEAQACGTPIVSTDAFAISETVENHKTGVLIKGDATSPAYLEQFLAKTVRLLQIDAVREKYSAAGPKSVEDRGLTWAKVAEKWEARFFEKLEARFANDSTKVVERLVFNGDLVPAAALATGERQQQDVAALMQLVVDPSSMTQEEIHQEAERHKPVYNALTQLLARRGAGEPKRVLDISSGFTTYGIFLAKNFPNAHVTMVHDQPDQVRELATSLGLTNLDVVASEAGLTGFDLVVLGDVLSKVEAPDDFAKRAAQALQPDGVIAFYTDFGPNAHRLRYSKHNRLWNLDLRDFQGIFPGAAGGMIASFLNGPMVDQGVWLGLASVKDASKIGSEFQVTERVEHRKLSTRPYRSVAASMIVKNEENNLLKCLKAVRPFVDRIVVADTGSTDSTIEFAGRYADEIRHVKFDNFSQARNESKAGLTEDWYFWLDADEELLGGDQLRKYVDSTVFNGFVIKQCVSGDTLISLPGRVTPIKDLVGKSGFHCWSYDSDQKKMVLSVVQKVEKTGTRKTIEVVMDAGVLRCTPDHRVMLRDGTYRQAGKLQPGDSLMPFYRSLTTSRRRERSLTGREERRDWWVHLNNGEAVKEHRYVYEQAVRKLAPNEVVHHKNEDYLDNRVENLEALDRGEHSRLRHTGVVRPAGVRERNQAAALKQHGSVAYSVEEMWAVIDANKGVMAKVASALDLSVVSVYHRLYRLGIDIAGIRKKWPSSAGGGKPRIHPRLKPLVPVAPNNHKVLEVREGPVEDVYDMQVAKTHNFVANGVVVHNCHLMIDVPGTFDTPIRLHRNKPEYKFVGLIHEHTEDTSRGPFGHGIRPAIIVGDMDLAHYGYPAEGIRRKKCSNRNMELLIRDLQENPDRPINKLLFMRDCLNIVKWHLSGGGNITRMSLPHALLNTCVALFLRHYNDRTSKEYKMTDPMAQEALKILAAFGLPFEDRKTPPFEVALSLRASVGAPVKTEGMAPSTRWFIDEEEFQLYMSKKVAELCLGVSGNEEKYKPFVDAKLAPSYLTDTEAAVDLLKHGANAFK